MPGPFKIFFCDLELLDLSIVDFLRRVELFRVLLGGGDADREEDHVEGQVDCG